MVILQQSHRDQTSFVKFGHRHFSQCCKGTRIFITLIKLLKIARSLIKIQVLLVLVVEMSAAAAFYSVAFGTAVAFFYQLFEKIIVLSVHGVRFVNDCFLKT